MFDDVTDDVCQGGLLNALPSNTGPDIDDGESTWSCELRCRGGRVHSVGRAPGVRAINLGCRSALLLAGELAGVVFVTNRRCKEPGNLWTQEGCLRGSFRKATVAPTMGWCSYTTSLTVSGIDI